MTKTYNVPNKWMITEWYTKIYKYIKSKKKEVIKTKYTQKFEKYKE